MSTFQSSEQMLNVLGGFFQFLADETDLGAKLLASKLNIRFVYKNPDGAISVNLTGPVADIQKHLPTTDMSTLGKADVEMSMQADVAHKFWLGQVNLVLAIARRDIVAKGSVPKILKLLPIIKPAYDFYPQYLSQKGITL